jgi:hypothetical protein
MAAVRFSGRTTDGTILGQRRRLEDWVRSRSLTARGEPIFAYYNDPLTPGPLRRNEVLLEVADAP